MLPQGLKMNLSHLKCITFYNFSHLIHYSKIFRMLFQAWDHISFNVLVCITVYASDSVCTHTQAHGQDLIILFGGNQRFFFFLGLSLSFKCVSWKFQVIKIILLPLKHCSAGVLVYVPTGPSVFLLSHFRNPHMLNGLQFPRIGAVS